MNLLPSRDEKFKPPPELRQNPAEVVDSRVDDLQGKKKTIPGEEKEVSERVVSSLLESRKHNKPGKVIGFSRSGNDNVNLVVKAGSIPYDKKRGINSKIFATIPDNKPTTYTTSSGYKTSSTVSGGYENNPDEFFTNSSSNFGSIAEESVGAANLSGYLDAQYRVMKRDLSENNRGDNADGGAVEEKNEGGEQQETTQKLSFPFCPIFPEIRRALVSDDIMPGDLPGVIFDFLKSFNNNEINPIQGSENTYELTLNLLEWMMKHKDMAVQFIPTVKTCVEAGYCNLHKYTRDRAEYEQLKGNTTMNPLGTIGTNGQTTSDGMGQFKSLSNKSSDLTGNMPTSKKLSIVSDDRDQMKHSFDRGSSTTSGNSFSSAPRTYRDINIKSTAEIKDHVTQIQTLNNTLFEKERVIEAMARQIESLTLTIDAIRRDQVKQQDQAKEMNRIIERERDKRKLCIICGNKINNITVNIYSTITDKISILEQATNELLTFEDLKGVASTYSSTLNTISDAIAGWENTLGIGPNFRERFNYSVGMRIETLKSILPENYVPRDTISDVCRIVKKMKTIPKMIYLKNMIAELTAREKDINFIKEHLTTLTKKTNEYMAASMELSEFFNNPYAVMKNNKYIKPSLPGMSGVSVDVDCMLCDYEKSIIIDEQALYASVYSFVGYCQFKNLCSYNNIKTFLEPQKLFIKWTSKLEMAPTHVSTLYHAWCACESPPVQFLVSFIKGNNSKDGFMFYLWATTWLYSGLLDITNNWLDTFVVKAGRRMYEKIYIGQRKIKQIVDVCFTDKVVDTQNTMSSTQTRSVANDIRGIGSVSGMKGQWSVDVARTETDPTNRVPSRIKATLLEGSKASEMIVSRLRFKEVDPSQSVEVPPVEILSACHTLTDIYILCMREKIDNGRVVYGNQLLSLQEKIRSGRNISVSVTDIYDIICSVVQSISPTVSDDVVFSIFNKTMQNARNIPSWQMIAAAIDSEYLLFPRHQAYCQSGPACRIVEIPCSDARFMNIISSCQVTVNKIKSNKHIIQWNPILVKQMERLLDKISQASRQTNYCDAFYQIFQITLKLYSIMHRAIWFGMQGTGYRTIKGSSAKELVIRDMELMVSMLESVAIQM